MKKMSEILYEKIYNSASSKRKNALNKIKKACDFLENDSKKLTVALVGRYCESKFKEPQTQSIRNSDKYVKYIKLREEERNKVNKDQINYEESIIVKDQSAQAIINMLQEEIKILNKSIQNLKKGTRQISPIDIDKFISESFGKTNPPQDLISFSISNNYGKNDIKHTQQIDLILEDVTETLNFNILEKYSDISIDYKNGKIFNKITGTIYWEKRN